MYKKVSISNVLPTLQTTYDLLGMGPLSDDGIWQ